MNSRNARATPPRRAAKGQGSIRQRSTGRWEGTVDLGVGVDGRRVKRSVSAVTRAEVVRRMAEVKADAGGQAVKLDKTATIGDALDAHLAHLENRHAAGNLGDSGLDTWRAAAKRCASIRAMRLDALTPAAIELWAAGLPGAGSTRRKTFLVLAGAARTARRDKLAPPGWDPFEGVTAPSGDPDKERAHATAGDVKAILEAADGPWRAMWAILACTGLRPGECRRLDWSDVDLDGQALRVERPGRGKNTTSVRRVPLIPQALDAVVELHDAAGRPAAGPLFPNTKGVPVDRWRQIEAFAEVAPAGLTPHSLRHGAATRMLEAGVPVHEVAAILGHATPTQTLTTYAHSVEKARRGALEVLGSGA